MQNYNKNKLFNKITLKPWQLHLLVSFIFLIFYNNSFWREVSEIVSTNLWMKASIFSLLVLLINFLLNLFCGKYTYKFIYPLVFIGASLGLYFINQYTIIIDRDMVQNVLETNPAEAGDFLNSSLLMYLFFLGIIPSILLLLVNVKFSTLKTELLTKLKITLLSVISIGLLLYISYPTYASIARNNRHISHLIIPTNFIFATASYANQKFQSANQPLALISKDAKLTQFWDNKKNKSILVIVVGETARADHFSLNGYEKPTNPNLKKQPLINFSQVNSCGTSTAVSLPCMFSHMDRDNFSKNTAKNSENLLDFLSNTGFSVQWRDNNTGCKGICNRVDSLDLTQEKNKLYCQTGECFDEILLTNITDQINKNPNNQVIVLHQKGSHGPAYYLRYPQKFNQFSPICETNKLQDCTQKEVENTYDNTILYTDFVVNKLIEKLKTLPDDYNTAMLYISDHGESLGENNIYLHGTPYFMAPDAQTHIPFFMWFSTSFMQQFNLNQSCLTSKKNTNLSHANLFHSVLGLLGISSQYYDAEKDIFSSCRV